MVSFRDVTLTGIDLARLSASMAARGPKWKSRLTAALQAGTSPGLAGEMVVSGSDGAMTVAHLDLAGPDGALHASGTADASTRRADFRGHIQLVANGLPINFTAVGLWPNLVHTFDVPPEASRQTHSPHRAKHR
jgi:hypothetical protein